MIKHYLLPAIWGALLALLPFHRAAAQVKYEREFGIRAAAVPQPARDFTAACFAGEKIKWYREINLGSSSIEAKVKKGGRHYSVEFDTAGKLQDVELRIGFSSLNDGLRQAIDSVLTGFCTKYKISKVQLQWTGPAAVLQELIRQGSSPHPHTVCFEIVYTCRKAGASKLFEALFDASGRLLTRLEIIPRNTDNLDY